jgi:pimeloyl-ACP methyl ester carboxylesterase
MSEHNDTPTVVLVHGGFADASFWAPVIKDLQDHDLPVLAPPNPLPGLAHDAEYIASYVNQIDGPVPLVGHSYGGAVISVAGASTTNAVGLVYVAAFALDEGESFGEIFGAFGETPLVGAVRPSGYPLPNGETAVELTIAPELYQEAFAADLPTEDIEVLAVSQGSCGTAGSTGASGASPSRAWANAGAICRGGACSVARARSTS